MSWDEEIEAKLGPVFSHEGGHALMALIQSVPCEGIYFERESERFCALFPPSAGGRTEVDYLVSAAGVAAELLNCPDRNSVGDGADRAEFDFPSAPSFDEAVEEACVILSRNRETLDHLVLILWAKVRSVDFDLGQLQEKRIGEMRYRVLLSQEELEAVVRPK